MKHLKLVSICGKAALLVALVSVTITPALADSKPSADMKLVIGAGDLVEVSVFDVPELAGKVRVNESGSVSLPLIGTTHVAGLTTEQAGQAIREKLISGKFLNNPQVSVFVSEYLSRGITVLGPVQRAGIYPLIAGNRLADALATAGGMTPLAGPNVIIAHRDSPDEQEFVDLSSPNHPNPELRAGDTVRVTELGVVYVVGEVQKPGGFPMDRTDHLTVLEAVALAQGTLFTAKGDQAKIIRKVSGRYEEIKVPLKKIISSKQSDMAMLNGDILFVPSSATKSSMKGLQNILGSVAGAAIYRLP